MALLVEDFCVVVVEGGPKAQKRYRKLLMQRIDWGDVADEEEDEDEVCAAPPPPPQPPPAPRPPRFLSRPRPPPASPPPPPKGTRPALA